VTAFHQELQNDRERNTTAAQLIRACEIGRAAACVTSIGNLPDASGDGRILTVRRVDEYRRAYGYLIRQNERHHPRASARRAVKTFPAFGL